MESLAQTLVRKRLWLVFVSFFLWMASATFLLPHLTPISVNYFASREAGEVVSCEDGKHGSDDHISSIAAACAAGSAEAARYVSLTALVSNAMLGLVVSPLVACLSDSYGRKPFFLACALSSATGIARSANKTTCLLVLRYFLLWTCSDRCGLCMRPACR